MCNLCSIGGIKRIGSVLIEIMGIVGGEEVIR